MNNDTKRNCCVKYFYLFKGVRVCESMLTLPAVIQVARRIHEWMGEKLQTYFKRDEKLINCMLIWCCCCWYLVLLVCFFMAFIVHGICPAVVRVACASQDSPFLLVKPA